ncbi:MAG: CusA/CzcA family heavy metal efflux RND transporter, partial [Cyanobacteria bacterium]|nr:CusA/CzcA family heavy metal efflux RND transporter [Cyanobacteriota bacterium]
ETVKEILIFSGGLVIIVLAAVLMHIPSALIVSVVIPLSLLFSFVAMKFTGLSANLMTLGAVDFGIIVDAGVVMVENIFRQLANAQKASNGVPIDRLAVVKSASKEVGKPIVFAIMIIVAVYLPLFTLEGIEGKMFHPLALTFIYALFGSLIVSLTFIPVLAYWVLRKPLVEKHNPVLELVRKKYEPILERAIHSPRPTLGLSFALLIGSLCIVPFLGTEFIPTLDEGSICVRVKLDPSVSHTTSRKVFGVAEAVLKKHPEVTVVVTKIGRSGMGSDLDGIDMADIYIGLKPKSEWKTTRSKEVLINRMADDISKIPGLMFSFSQPIADMIDDIVSGLRADLGIKVFGESIEKVDEIAGKIQNVVKSVPGAADINRELCLGLPQLNIRVNRKAIARYGLNASDVQRIVESALAGTKVTEVIEGNKRFDILVRFNASFRANPDAISAILVSTPTGGMVPLKALAEITEREGVVMVNREEGQRRAAVLVNVRGRDLGGFVAECQERIAKEVELPKGYRIVWGGQFENQQRATTRLCIVVPIVLLFIFLLLFSSFNSIKNAALVMLNVPFAMIGGIVALFVSHQILSVPALIGFIALFGIAVQNGVILVSYIMQLEQSGKTIDEAVREGAYVRFRPVLMTALVATVGLVPKVLSDGTGSEIQRPLATVILGGLVSATLLTLIVLPSMYRLINKRTGSSRFPWNRTPACVAALHQAGDNKPLVSLGESTPKAQVAQAAAPSSNDEE